MNSSNTTRSEEVDFEQIKGFLKTAETKVSKAGKIVSIDRTLAFQAAYEAMLRASLGFMLSFGKRPRSVPGHHKITIDFCSKKLGKEYKSIVKTFDLMRRKRNQAIYEPDAFVTNKEAKDAIVIAEKYLKIISDKISKDHPQAELFG